MSKYRNYAVAGAVLVLFGLCGCKEGELLGGRPGGPPPVSAAPEITASTGSPAAAPSPENTFDLDSNSKVVYGDETVYNTIPRLSLEDEFPGFGTVTLTVGQVKDSPKFVCLLVNGDEALYVFPDSYLGGVHLISDAVSDVKYEGIFYRDVNGDDEKDVVILTHGAVGNWPQITNLATVFLQTDDGFTADTAISDASIADSIEKSGLDDDENYLTIDDICRYYEEQSGQ